MRLQDDGEMRGSLPVAAVRARAVGSLACAFIAVVGCNGWQHETIPLTSRTCSLTVRVSQLDGRPVTAATVIVGDRHATSDAAGLARLDGVAEGGILVLVRAAGFASEAAAARLDLSLGETRTTVVLQPAGPSERRLLFGGDLSFDGRIDDPNHDGITTDGLLPPGPAATGAVESLLAGIRPLFAQADLVTVNLATVLGDGKTPHPQKSDRALAPPQVAKALRWAGLGVINLGTGHAYDFLDSGVAQTTDALDAAGLVRLGAGRDLGEAARPAVAALADLQVAQASLSSLVGRGSDPTRDLVPTFEARADKGGVVEATPEAVAAAVTPLSQTAGAIIAHLAAGHDWDETPIELAPLAMAAAGARATLVIGDGPRLLGGLSWLGDTLVATSLGQLVSGDDRPEARRAVLLDTRFTGSRMTAAWLRPIALDRGRPFLAGGKLAARIVRHVATLSAPGVVVLTGDRGLVVRAHASDERASDAPVTIGTDGTSAILPVVSAALDDYLTTIACASADGSALPVEVGRDLLWSGDFEDQLAGGGKGLGTGWSLGAPDVAITDQQPHGGALALALARKSGNIGAATARATGLLTLAAGHRHTLSGCWRLEGDAASVSIGLGLYNDRTFGAPRAALAATVPGSPTEAWTCFETSTTALAFDQLATVEIALGPPRRGTTRVFVDDLALVRWDDPAPGQPLGVPNEIELARCRADHAGPARLSWTTRHDRQP
jgi:poly-gamma-glutamate capsule biosynthesis protein CapA/YwtB (metallophosphatase superfamily)